MENENAKFEYLEERQSIEKERKKPLLSMKDLYVPGDRVVINYSGLDPLSLIRKYKEQSERTHKPLAKILKKYNAFKTKRSYNVKVPGPGIEVEKKTKSPPVSFSPPIEVRKEEIFLEKDGEQNSNLINFVLEVKKFQPSKRIHRQRERARVKEELAKLEVLKALDESKKKVSAYGLHNLTLIDETAELQALTQKKAVEDRTKLKQRSEECFKEGSQQVSKQDSGSNKNCDSNQDSDSDPDSVSKDESQSNQKILPQEEKNSRSEPSQKGNQNSEKKDSISQTVVSSKVLSRRSDSLSSLKSMPSKISNTAPLPLKVVLPLFDPTSTLSSTLVDLSARIISSEGVQRIEDGCTGELEMLPSKPSRSINASDHLVWTPSIMSQDLKLEMILLNSNLQQHYGFSLNMRQMRLFLEKCGMRIEQFKRSIKLMDEHFRSFLQIELK